MHSITNETHALKMVKEILIAVVLVISMSGHGSDASDCCGSYTDVTGTYHKSMLCSEYCCLTVGVAYKTCCSDSDKQIPATKNQNDECVQNWISEHIWVPIVGGIVGLIILIGICTCCCCCGCCCRRNQKPVIVYAGAAQPSTTVAMANTTIVDQNPAHAGYCQ